MQPSALRAAACAFGFFAFVETASAQYTQAELERAGHVARRMCSGAGLAEVSALLPGGGNTQITNIVNFIQQQSSPLAITENAETTSLLSLYPIPTVVGASDPSHPNHVAQGAQSWTIEQLAETQIIRAAWSERKLCEVMTRFWQEHFSTNWGSLFNYFRSEFSKPVYAAPPYSFNTQQLIDAKAREYAAYFEWQQNDRFRLNCLGRFQDLLEASGKGGAMMMYLNTAESEAPDPNENYARELFELHTMGITSPVLGAPVGTEMRNYVYQDIQDGAAIFSGWTLVDQDLANPTGVPNFQFAFIPTNCPTGGGPATSGHQATCPNPGSKTLFSSPQVNPLVYFDPLNPGQIGFTINENQTTEAEGLALMGRLANSPVTAWFVSNKLIDMLVTEEDIGPFHPLVMDCLTAWFLQPGGDIKSVVQTILLSDIFLNDTTIRFNLERQPVGWVAQTISLFHGRGFDANPAGLTAQADKDRYNRDRIKHLRVLIEEFGGQQLFRFGPPDGFERGDGELLTTNRMLGSIRFRQELYDWFDLGTYPWHREPGTQWDPSIPGVPNPGIGFDYLNALPGLNFIDETSLTDWFTLIGFQNTQTSGDYNAIFLFWYSDLGGLLGTPLAMSANAVELAQRITSGLAFFGGHTLNQLK